jgi:AsmA protein
MSKSLKITFFAVGVFLGFLVLITVALRLFVDVNAYKPRLEAAVSEAAGMEVRVGGRLGIGFFPGLFVTLEDVHIRNREMEVASATEARLGIDLLPLFQGKVRVGKIVLKHPRISIERDHAGNFNVAKPEAVARALPNLELAEVSLSHGTLLYTDKQSGGGFEAGDCSLDVRHLRLLRGERPDIMKNLSLTAEVACGDIRTKGFAASDVEFSLSGKKGVFDLKPVRMHVFGGQGSGSIRADFSGAANLYSVRFSLSQFHVEEFFQTLLPQKVAEGPMDFSVNLSMQGKTVDEVKQTMQGEISLRGENLALHGRDLDAELSRFESSQNFNLVDMGAFFFAGPLGVVVTKGYDFASIFRGSEGRSEIPMLVSDWKVERGVAQTQDVAMATKQNRIALQGGLDFVNQQFVDMTVALIDAQGCVTVRQIIHGTFHKPVVEKPSILKSLTGPARHLLKEGRDLLPGGKCQVFYTGSVAPPK